MPNLKFDPDAEESLRRLAAANSQAPGYLAVKRLLFDLRDEDPADPVRGNPLMTIGEGRGYYKEVGRHPEVVAVVWKRFPEVDLVAIAYVGEPFL